MRQVGAPIGVNMRQHGYAWYGFFIGGKQNGAPFGAPWCSMVEALRVEAEGIEPSSE